MKNMFLNGSKSCIKISKNIKNTFIKVRNSTIISPLQKSIKRQNQNQYQNSLPLCKFKIKAGNFRHPEKRNYIIKRFLQCKIWRQKCKMEHLGQTTILLKWTIKENQAISKFRLYENVNKKQKI